MFETEKSKYIFHNFLNSSYKHFYDKYLQIFKNVKKSFEKYSVYFAYDRFFIIIQK